ncbi:major facilitator superfamily domain-containing protein [Umbelopsis sp. PMI_123]|nr:major facilitator superfamily domain-containing protein [Umbelopsis sp. PMI_123]
MTEVNAREVVLEDTSSSTVVNNDSEAKAQEAVLDNFYEMHLTDTREVERQRSRHEQELVASEKELVNDDLEKIESQVPPASDGGYGWVICAGSFVCSVISFGVGTSCFYVNYPPFQRGVMQSYYLTTEMAEVASETQLTFVGTIAFIFINGMGPPVQILRSIFGARTVIAGGCVIMSLGLILAGFSYQAWHLYLTQGIMFGFGAACMYITTMGVVPQWFDKRRGLALGIAASGSGIGGLIMPFIMTALLQKFDAGWTYRIIGFICLGLGLASSIFIKEKYPDKSGRKKITDIVQWSVLKDNNLKLWCAAATIALFGYLIPFFYLPSYAAMNGLTASQGSTLISIISGLNFVGRIANGWFGDNIGRLNMLIIAMFISAACNFLIWPLTHNIGGLIAFSCIYGFFCGAYFTMMAAITAYISKMEKFPSAFSVFLMFNIASSFGPPIAGAIQSGTNPNSYISVQMFAGACFLAGTILMILLKIKLTKSIFSKV